ncbi:MAG: hemolysin family protein [Marinosulfonomonas sp.]|nr:hemolysin family protein [Marinosulfonomonas sp.]
MGDTTDGSSDAAQSARDGKTGAQRGFWGRIIGALSPTDTGEDAALDAPNMGVATTDVRGMLNLSRMSLEDVAVPKAEIVAVPDDIKKDDLVDLFRKSGLTRIPVYTDTLDTPIGLVHLKDFALKHGFSSNGGRFDLKELVRPLLFAPPSMPIGVLLQKMQADRTHMALVIDEYGGVDGLVTLEDLVEQVIGEIEDEHDQDVDQFWVKEGPGIYLALARTPLEEFEAEIGRKLVDAKEDEEIETLGGLVFLLSGHVPARGEVVVHPDGPEFEVVEADLRRIKRLRVRLPDVAGE